MKYFRIVPLFAILAAMFGWSLGQQPQQPQEPQEQQPQEGQQEGQQEQQTLPPREVGKVRTQAELEAWNAVASAPQAQRAEQARQFLQQYPDSGMTPHAHYIIAMSAFRQGNYSDFTMHGEAALEELPEAVDLSTQLAFYYAETKQYDKAIEIAKLSLETLQAPASEGQMNAQQRDQLMASAYYALGRSHLGGYMDDKSEKGNLDKAVEYLQKALEHNPTDDYAYFRLAGAHRQQEDAEKAAANYAKAAAVGGSIAVQAEDALKDLLKIVKGEEFYNTANKKAEQQKWDDAINLYAKASAADPAVKEQAESSVEEIVAATGRDPVDFAAKVSEMEQELEQELQEEIQQRIEEARAEVQKAAVAKQQEWQEAQAQETAAPPSQPPSR